ncbi:MAG: pyroglutamyl-peptidase I [Luteolibacter sp.]
MPILITAFGPFGGRAENASSLALRDLRKSHPEIRTRILPVDAVLAPARLRQAIRHIRPSAVIMLGESAQSTGIQLETTAWNSKDFSIPDIAGRKPKGVPVKGGAAESLASTLPLKEMHSALNAGGHPVALSNDPGRYLCNQLFFAAMNYLETNGISIPAGFIHLPLENHFPTSRAAAAIGAVIRVCEATAARAKDLDI